MKNPLITVLGSVWKNPLRAVGVIVCQAAFALPAAMADNPASSTLPSATAPVSGVAAPAYMLDPTSAPAIETHEGDLNRYGPFGIYDHRSLYGKGVFPEPSIVDDSDGEVNEVRIDWGYQTGKGQHTNGFLFEVEHGNGLWTAELEMPYNYNTSNMFDPATGTVDHERIHGFDNINPGFRFPIFQYVSNDEFFDTTFGLGIEIGVPTNSPLSKNTEIVPKIFNDTRIGEHFTIQTILGYSFLRGSADSGGGEQHFEYGFVFGWDFPHNELPIPGVQDFIPIVELQGETLLTTHDAGDNSLMANFAFRANLFSIGKIQPRIGVGYLFPCDKGAREDFRWGVYTSLVFEF